MQIKDLSVSEAHLAEVRGGINNVTGRIYDDSTAKNTANVGVSGDAVTFSGGIAVGQTLDARKTLSIDMPVQEVHSYETLVGISGSSFSLGFPW